jgi:hypothetical protein
MNTHQQLEVPLKTRLFCKLNPSRFPRMTSVMAAIVGHLLDAPLGDPRIVEIAVTSDGFVLGRTDAGASLSASRGVQPGKDQKGFGARPESVGIIYFVNEIAGKIRQDIAVVLQWLL